MRKTLIALALLLGGILSVALVMAIDSARKPTLLAQADRIEVYKAQRSLELWRGQQLIKRYRIALGEQPQGHKRWEGDARTPEGQYRIDWRNPHSRFHRALHISYPNDRDRQHAQALGRSPGGDIMIHGLPRGLDLLAVLGLVNWTEGCIAVNNREIEEIWQAVPNGTFIHIHP